MAAGTRGKVVQVLGAVIDCEFPPDQMPAIFSAVEIYRDGTVTEGTQAGIGGITGQPTASSNGHAAEGKGLSAAPPNRLVLEVEQHIGNNWVRCVAMDTTDGIRRGSDAIDTGRPVHVPV